jgi:hypothetical protein
MPASPGNPLRYTWVDQINTQVIGLIFNSGADTVGYRTINVHWNGSASPSDSFDVRTAAGAANTLFTRWYAVAPSAETIMLEIKVPGGSAVSRLMGIERMIDGEDMVNDLPVFTPIVGSPFTIDAGYIGNLIHMTASDPDGQPLRWSRSVDPPASWIVVNGNGNDADLFIANAVPGTYNVRVLVSDGITDVDQGIQIIVNAEADDSQPDLNPETVMADDSAGVTVMAREAMQDIVAGQIVRLGNGGFWLADSNSLEHAEAWGIALCSADENQPLVAATAGRIMVGDGTLQKGMFYAVSYVPGKLIKVTAIPTGAYCTIVGLALETNLLLLTVQPLRVQK